MSHRPTPPIGHLASAWRILNEDRTTQVTELCSEALRRFKPAGPGMDYSVAAKALALALTVHPAVTPTAPLVRDVLVATVGGERASGAIAAWLRGFMPPVD